MAYQGSSITHSASRTLSRRAYYGLIGILLVLGFGVTALTSWVALQPTVASAIQNNAMVFGIGSIAITIVGMVLIGVGTSKDSVGLMMAGYMLFALSFGFTTSIWLPRYNFDTVTQALVLTAGISTLFTALGILFPNLIEKAAVVAMFVLIGVMLASLFMFFFGGVRGWVDYVVVGVFAIFIGYDTHMASRLEPTVTNAVGSATNLFLDIINIFLRILNILDRD